MTGRAPAGGRCDAAPLEELVFVDEFEVWILRKRIKNINLHVKQPDGRIEVSAPLRVGTLLVRAFVREKRDWILRQQKRIAASPQGRAAAASPDEVAQWREVVQAFVPSLIAKWEPIMGVKDEPLGQLSAVHREDLHQREAGALSARMPGVRGRARAVPSSGTRPRPALPCADGHVPPRLEGHPREAALGAGRFGPATAMLPEPDRPAPRPPDRPGSRRRPRSGSFQRRLHQAFRAVSKRLLG